MEKSFRIQTESDMLSLGRKIGEVLPRSCFIALYGNLGAGKSVLARGIASWYGIESLPSPTFTIVQEYPSDPPFFHFDVYRIADEEELWAIGYEDYLARDGIIVMEWADLVPGCLPKNRIDIRIEGDGTASRNVRICTTDALYERMIGLL